jgi:hypothetical protein
MLIYFAFPVNPNASDTTVSASVKDRGLRLLKAKPSSVSTLVLLDSPQPGYQGYLSCLPAFMEATATGRITAIRNRSYPIGAINDMLPLAMPSLIYDFNRPLNDAVKTQLLEHSSVVRTRGKDSFIMDNPTVAKIRVLMVDMSASTDTRHIVGSINANSMKQFIVVIRVLTMFLRTHRYPAFRHISDMQANTLLCVQPINKKRKRNDASALECVAPLTDLIDGIDNDTEYVPTETDPLDIPITLTRAKPSISNDLCWGPIAHLPNASGLFVPYVKDLCIADTQTVPDLIANYFARCLSPNINGVPDALHKLKSAWGTICFTDPGHEITHICKCIEIALKAQCTVYPVFTNNIYEGTAILGCGYTLSMNREMFTPMSYAELQNDVKNGSLHTKSIKEIKAEIDDEEYYEDVDNATSIRELSIVLKEISLDSTQRRNITKSAHNLAYTAGYWSTSANYVLRVLELLADSDKSIETDTPMHPDYIFSDDRVEMVLSAFGHFAPSFMIQGGTTFDLKQDKIPNTFGVRTVAIASAITDMKYVIQEGKITNNKQNLSKKHGDTTVNGQNKKDVWKLLSTVHTNQLAPNEEENHVEVDATLENVIEEFW